MSSSPDDEDLFRWEPDPAQEELSESEHSEFDDSDWSPRKAARRRVMVKVPNGMTECDDGNKIMWKISKPRDEASRRYNCRAWGISKLYGETGKTCAPPWPLKDDVTTRTARVFRIAQNPSRLKGSRPTKNPVRKKKLKDWRTKPTQMRLKTVNPPSERPRDNPVVPHDYEDVNAQFPELTDADSQPPFSADTAQPPRNAAPVPQPLQINDIRRVFHPHAKRSEVTMSFEDYRATQVPPQRRHPIHEKPWAPFRTRFDFEVAEFAQDAKLTKNQINVLISLIQRCSKNPEGMTLQNHADLEKQWTFASEKCTEASYRLGLWFPSSYPLKFQQFEVAVPYKGVDRTFEMYARPLWEWAMDIVQDPHLADFFVWDTEQCYFFNGTKWKCFYAEPWTAEAMWDIQVGVGFSCWKSARCTVTLCKTAEVSIN
ncbi:hypothetical protein K438DRAFT_2177885 [Mycena galopus ATCC 62051]|nr:hypothetical protein K438DRAFT_2177885 [Mycena galopus ATCC 62051]